MLYDDVTENALFSPRVTCTPIYEILYTTDYPFLITIDSLTGILNLESNDDTLIEIGTEY